MGDVVAERKLGLIHRLVRFEALLKVAGLQIRAGRTAVPAHPPRMGVSVPGLQGAPSLGESGVS